MERFSNRTINEMCVITLPPELIKKTKWQQGDLLTFTHLGNIAILQPKQEIYGENQTNLTLDAMGRVTLPLASMSKLDWNVRCEICVYYSGDGVVILKKAQD